MSAQIACANCGSYFIPKKEWAAYCGNACRIKAYRAKNRTVAVVGLEELETALVEALAAVRAGDVPEARMQLETALHALPAEHDPLLHLVGRAVVDGHSAAAIARGSGLGSGTTFSQWRRGERVLPKTREKVAKWLAAHGYCARE